MFYKKEDTQKKFKLDKQAKQRIEAEFSDKDLSEYSNYEIPEIPKPRKYKKWMLKLAVRIVIICIIVLFINLCILLWSGKIWFNEPKKRDYPVRGPIVDESLGNISWENFASQNIQMAYIRATKNCTYEDENFQKNKKGASETDLPVGALHIFDIKLDGKQQAEHFISVCGNKEEMTGWLIPAVEVKNTGLYKILPIDYDKATQNLLDFVETIKDEYGYYPIIKCNSKIYKNIISRDEFSNCPVWYESFYSQPDEEIDWEFWGYNNRVKFSYYESGKYLEMVLFNGSEEDFSNYIIK